MLTLSSPEEKKKKERRKLCKCSLVNLEAISPVTVVSTVSEIKGLERGEILEEMRVV